MNDYYVHKQGGEGLF